MKIFSKANLKALLAGVTATTMLLTTAAIMPEQKAKAADTCVVNTGTEYQIIRGVGGINHPEWTGQDMTAAQRQKAFGNGPDELGFTVLRVFVNPDKNQWNKALPTAQAASKMGAYVFASPWEPPANLAESGGGNGKLHLPKSNYGAYAQHLNDFGNYMKNNGVDLYAISVQNEPDYAHDWTYWSTDETTDFLANYGDKITSTRVMSPESFQYAPENASWVKDGGKKFYTKIMNNQKAWANCDLFGTHFYGTTRDWMDFPALEKCGKEIWMTEVYVPNSEANSNDRWPEALQVAENMHNGFVVGNMSAYVWWYIRRSYGPMKEDGTISKRGYMMAQYSKYVRPEAKRIAATEQPASNVLISAYKNKDGSIAVVAINKGTSAVTQNFSLSGGEKIGEIKGIRSSGSENLATVNGIQVNGSGFSAQLNAQSVTTFVLTCGNIEPDANGYFYHDTFEGSTDNWAGRGAATVLTSGRTAYKGTESLLVQERTSAWHGALKDLNAAAFVPGKEFSFSVDAMYLDGGATDTFYMKLQYTDGSGETQYSTIAEANAIKGEWVQLANPNYKIPADAKNMQIYVETAESTINFYIDEAIGALPGTKVEGPAPISFTLGDVTCDGVINGFDVAAAKKGLAKGTFASTSAKLAADVNQSGDIDDNDVVQISDFVLARIDKFTAVEKPVDFAALEQKFSGISLAQSLKKANYGNPLMTQRFSADPGVMEYNGRVYVYTTNDTLMYDNNGQVTGCTYSIINTLNCMSSADLVNWTDHGKIPVAGNSGIAKWAGCSWAPHATHKTINGKEKFFLYFANNANGIGVLTSDSPTGPWTDPIGRPLVSRNTPTCDKVAWVFDPAVLLDDDGTGYLYFGGGTPEGGNPADPGTARVVKLGSDMTSLAGDPVKVNAPYLFEDSGINKVGNKYLYSYCTNWSTGGNNIGITANATIAYCVSDNPMGPFTFAGECFKNPASFGKEFGMYNNNHHTFIKFKNNYYLFYHARGVEYAMGIDKNYRSAQVDKATISDDGKISYVTATMTGPGQIELLNPYETVQAETFSHMAGVTVEGLNNTTVSAKAGNWTRVSGVDCGTGAKSLTVKASSSSGAVIKVCTESQNGNAVSYVEIPAGGSMQEITVPVVGLSGKQDLYFVFSGNVSFDSWVLSK